VNSYFFGVFNKLSVLASVSAVVYEIRGLGRGYIGARTDTTVWTHSRQGSRYEPNCCLGQRLHWSRSDWRVVFQQLPTVWPIKVSLFQVESGQTPAAFVIGFECCCNG